MGGQKGIYQSIAFQSKTTNRNRALRPKYFYSAGIIRTLVSSQADYCEGVLEGYHEANRAGVVNRVTSQKPTGYLRMQRGVKHKV